MNSSLAHIRWRPDSARLDGLFTPPRPPAVCVHFKTRNGAYLTGWYAVRGTDECPGTVIHACLDALARAATPETTEPQPRGEPTP